MRRVLCPIDFSEAARAAYRAGLGIAEAFGAELWVLHTCEVEAAASVAELEKTIKHRVNEVWAKDLGREVQILVRPGAPGPAIIETAKEQDIDLIILGAGSDSGRLLGPTAAYVIDNATCQVHAVHSGRVAAPAVHGGWGYARRRLLLVELVTAGSDQRAVSFPFIQGHARRCGLPTRWVRLVQTPELSRADRDQILHVVSNEKSSVVLFNESPSELVARELEGLPWLPRVAALPGPMAEAISRATRELGLSAPQTIEPDYRWEPIGQAHAEPQLPCIVETKLASAEQQLVGLLVTHSRDPRLAIRLDIPPSELVPCAELVIARDVPPSDFVLAWDVATVTTGRAILEKTLTAWHETSHLLRLTLTGPVPLAGDKTIDTLVALHTLCDLASLYPKGFAFSGLRFTTFAPGADLGEVSSSLAVIAGTGLLGSASFMDQATRGAVGDDAVGQIEKVLLRVAAGHDDPSPWALLRFASALVDTAFTYPDLPEPSALIEGAHARLSVGAPVSGPRAPEPKATVDRPLLKRSPREDYLARLTVRLLHQRVLRLGAKDLELALVNGVTEEDIVAAVPVARVQEVAMRDKRKRHLVLGRDVNDVEQFLRLAPGSTTDGDAWQDAVGQIGKLLGYPACCSAAFAELPYFAQNDYPWLHVARRVAWAGSVPYQFNPAAGWLVNYVPCSLDCAPTLRRANTILADLRGAIGDPQVDALAESLQNPWILSLAQETAVVELCPEDPPGERFRYVVREGQRQYPLIRLVAEGDELVVEETQIWVLRRGRRHAALGGRAFVWWHEKPTQVGFWRALGALRNVVLGGRDSPLPSPLAEDCRFALPDPAAVEPAPCARSLGQVVRRVLRALGPGASFDGYRVTNVGPDHEQLSVMLTKGDVELHLLLARRQDVPKAYVTAGPFALMHSAEKPFDEPTQRRAVQLFARALAREATALRG